MESEEEVTTSQTEETAAPQEAPAQEAPVTETPAPQPEETKAEEPAKESAPQKEETKSYEEQMEENIAKKIDAIGQEAKPVQQQQPKPQPVQPQAPQQPQQKLTEEESLLQGVSSEKGRNRLRTMLKSGKEAMEINNTFVNAMKETGMSPDDFRTALNVRAALGSTDPQVARNALAALRPAIEQLVRISGEKINDIDPLSDMPELKERVSNYELTEQDAIQLAQAKRQEMFRQQQAEAYQQSQQDFEQQKVRTNEGISAATQMLASQSGNADHAERMAYINRYMANKQNVDRFVKTFSPEQWGQALMFMYNNAQIAPRQQSRTQQPLRTHHQALGTRAPNPNLHGEDRILAVMDRMGI